jgi:hypothetical protein
MGVLLDPEVLIREYNEGRPELEDLLRSFRDRSTGSGLLPVEVLRPAFQSRREQKGDGPFERIVLERRERSWREGDALAKVVMGKVPSLMAPVRKCSSARRLGGERPLRMVIPGHRNRE